MKISSIKLELDKDTKSKKSLLTNVKEVLAILALGYSVLGD